MCGFAISGYYCISHLNLGQPMYCETWYMGEGESESVSLSSSSRARPLIEYIRFVTARFGLKKFDTGGAIAVAVT